MTHGTETLIIGVALTNLVLLGSSRLIACIRFVAIQGVLIGLLPLLAHERPGLRALLLGALIIGLKGIAFPRLLAKALRDADVRREVEPLVGYPLSLLFGLLALGVALRLGAHLPAPGPGIHPLVIPVSIATIFTGWFVLISRRKALSQVLGYLVVENGIYAFGLALVEGIPLLVELGILLDVFVAVFVMGIVIYHISREFDHMDADQLNTLKG